EVWWSERHNVGEFYRKPSRTVTEAHFAAFQMLSGDNHPIHYDVEFCRAHGLRGMLAHGFQVLAFSAVGAGSFPHMIGERLRRPESRRGLSQSKPHGHGSALRRL